MAIKPGVLCTLEKDKLIDTQQGFVDTFNWVVASVNNLKGGQNCEVSWPAPDTPQIDSAASESEGGGGGGRVDDVSSETYQNGESLLIEYVDDTPDKHIPLSFVKDVSSATYQSKPALKVEYSSGAQDKYIELPSGGGDVQFTGTTGTTNEDTSFTFASANDSNVTVNCRGTTITIGVYYV